MMLITVQYLSGLLQQRFRSGNAAVEHANLVNGQRIVASPRHAGINPRTGKLIHKAHRII